MGGVAANRDESPLSKGPPATPRVAIPKHNMSARPNKNIRSFMLVSPSLEFLCSVADGASDVFDKVLFSPNPRSWGTACLAYDYSTRLCWDSLAGDSHCVTHSDH